MITYHRRGIHALPHTAVNGSFPFHLFESSFKKASLTSIAITPAPLAGDDAHSRELLNNLGGWSHKLLSGDQLDYTGSREYEVGMAVRRWDFPSWARLGIPIVREYQSPSVQKVFLIIDTTLDDNAWHDDSDEHPLLERMLSLATTAIHELTKQTVKIQFFLTTSSGHRTDSGVFLTDADHESLLIQLAAAAPVKGEQGDRQINEALEIAERSPTLVLTTRNTLKMSERLSRTCTVIRTDPPIRTDAPETPRPNAITRLARGKQSRKSPADSQSNPERIQQGSSTNASPDPNLINLKAHEQIRSSHNRFSNRHACDVCWLDVPLESGNGHTGTDRGLHRFCSRLEHGRSPRPRNSVSLFKNFSSCCRLHSAGRVWVLAFLGRNSIATRSMQGTGHRGTRISYVSVCDLDGQTTPRASSMLLYC